MQRLDVLPEDFIKEKAAMPIIGGTSLAEELKLEASWRGIEVEGQTNMVAVCIFGTKPYLTVKRAIRSLERGGSDELNLK